MTDAAPRRLAVLVSGHGSNLQALLDACADGRLPAQVALVLSNRPEAYALERARQAGVPTAVLSLRAWKADGGSREGYDEEVARQVRAVQPDLVVLAGWMLVLGPAFLDRVGAPVLNLHPALPGAFPGTDAIARAHAACHLEQLQWTGVMVHYVVPEVDAGPVVLSEAIPLVAGEDLASLEARVHDVEHRVLVEAVGTVLAGP